CQVAHICSHSSHDVGPGAATYLLVALVGGYRLEHVVATSIAFGDVFDGGSRRDLIARDHQRAPLELLPAVHHQGEVELKLGIEDRRPHRGGALEDDEHWRSHDICITRLASGSHVEMDGIRLSHRARVLLDLLS